MLSFIDYREHKTKPIDVLLLSYPRTQVARKSGQPAILLQGQKRTEEQKAAEDCKVEQDILLLLFIDRFSLVAAMRPQGKRPLRGKRLPS